MKNISGVVALLAGAKGRGKMNFLNVVALLAGAMSTLVLSCLWISAHAQCPTLVWYDEFTGTALNTSDWNYETGASTVNNELEYYTSRSNNLVVSNGTLKIIALQENYGGRAYTSAKINSSGHQNFKYGRMEASIKLPKTQGLWPAFWMMPQNSVNGSWPSSGEIDIMEELGSNPYKDFGTIHYGTDPGTGHKSSGGTYQGANDLSAGFHTYAIEWKPDTITWFLDNNNFYTITKTGIAPSYWPFNDDNFFFILNVAVGGWFGGNPDGTTVFPQTMEVDYVRVYNNPYTLVVDGRGKVFSGSTQTYTLKNGSAASYNWTVPAGASITAGQGTKTVSVLWGTTSGVVSADAVDTCGTYTFTKDVIVYKDSCQFMFDDFQTHRTVSYTGSTGTAYNPASSNPNTSNSVNTSPTVGYYKRNGAVQYDTYFYEGELISDAGIYENNQREFYIDVYTSAPAGITININLEDKTKTGGSYPLGRRSIYAATTTKQYQWERLKFSMVILNNGVWPNQNSTTSASQVNQITFLFNPNSYTSDYYYLDNFMSIDPVACPAVTGLKNSYNDQSIIISPNPASDEITIRNNSADPSDIILSITDILGREVINGKIPGGTQSSDAVNILGLSPGVYFVNLISGQDRKVKKLIVE
jgi:beta-glucanase (GH16 family)